MQHMEEVQAHQAMLVMCVASSPIVLMLCLITDFGGRRGRAVVGMGGSTIKLGWL